MAKRRPTPVRRDAPVTAAAPETAPTPAAEGLWARALRFGRRREVLLVAALTLIFSSYYYWTAAPCTSMLGECSPNHRVMGRGMKLIGPYNVLAESFLAGQVKLIVAPDPRLLRMPDPYEPAQNWALRLHDMSLYQGAYYLPFGPAPALVLFAPFVFIFGVYLHDAIGCAVLAVGAYAATCAVLRLFLKTLFPAFPFWMYGLLCVGLGFCNTYPYLLRRPSVYEVAIASGQFFLMMAVLFLGRVALGSSHPFRHAVIGGIMAALAFGSRPQLLLPGGALLLMLLISMAQRERWKTAVAAAVPLAIGGLAMAWYNYARFGSPFEFGYRYQLAGINNTKIQFFEAGRIPISLYYYLICPLKLSSVFPFVKVAPTAPFQLPPTYFGLESVAGALWLCPLLLVMVAAPWMWMRRREDPRPVRWVLALTVSAVAVLCVDGSLGATMRYVADASNLLFVAASLMTAWLLVSIPPRYRTGASAAVVVLLAIGMIGNAAIGMTGYYNNFKEADPNHYRSIEAFFQPVSHALSSMGIRP
jgi:hypothetical protein